MKYFVIVFTFFVASACVRAMEEIKQPADADVPEVVSGQNQTQDQTFDAQTEASPGTCSICLTDFAEVLKPNDGTCIPYPCTHRFHNACINRWLLSDRSNRFLCPNCRAPLPESSAQGSHALVRRPILIGHQRWSSLPFENGFNDRTRARLFLRHYLQRPGIAINAPVEGLATFLDVFLYGRLYDLARLYMIFGGEAVVSNLAYHFSCDMEHEEFTRLEMAVILNQPDDVRRMLPHVSTSLDGALELAVGLRNFSCIRDLLQAGADPVPALNNVRFILRQSGRTEFELLLYRAIAAALLRFLEQAGHGSAQAYAAHFDNENASAITRLVLVANNLAIGNSI